MFGDGVMLALGLAAGWILLSIGGLIAVVLIFYTIVGIQGLRANADWRRRQKGCPQCGGTDDPERGLGLCRDCMKSNIERLP